MEKNYAHYILFGPTIKILISNTMFDKIVQHLLKLTNHFKHPLDNTHTQKKLNVEISTHTQKKKQQLSIT